ncbi:hypothetical protein C7B65_08785 [Phormidesmis priestleyi ULC007]|uniref:Uncharacterized protein n=2 Tax=Phormidesmis priestleyi TaxID=268141 RepID=A0A2T1DI23_9CYAN|nr:hypothetical protein C7B65_08785 [Phormidesmis priestleyi ULC007]PZO49067.1 MAG: hypothetical protein DCF14_15105 [Phormidesmis priestleyi]
MKRTWLIALTLTLITVALLVPRSDRFLKKPSTLSWCPESAIASSDHSTDHSTEKIHASKIIVEPWEGRHNVYGIFVLPSGYQANHFFAVSVDESNLYCGGVKMLDQPAYGVSIQPGERIAIGHLRTRTALWLLTKGKQEELEQPSNWVLRAEKQG